ncbi:hypothetical protein [Alicyclobacillus fastidiosus]|uniref:hypothetical protein n=1 Tax=Alicyclobacillus fastidiosus TaxID=392011 RepID=UPI0024E18E04|nr:hypothetical protein [Alicyclobacillus fastidiosus]
MDASDALRCEIARNTMRKKSPPAGGLSCAKGSSSLDVLRFDGALHRGESPLRFTQRMRLHRLPDPSFAPRVRA